jgi:uncharacterized protein
MTAIETAEPTMEEILASIRKIISDEQVAPAADTSRPALVAERAETIAEVVPEPAPHVTARNSFRPSTDVLELTDSVEQRLRVPASPALLSAEAEDNATAKMSALAGMMTRNYPGSENTLEGMVQEMLRPMLKTWLDQNLPDMVEAIVTREIARISGRAR